MNDSRVDYSLQTVQSIFFHNSILNSAYRSIIEDNDCGCTPHPAYFIDKMGFWCQEDYMINPKKLLSVIKDSKYKVQDREIKAYQYLKENSTKTKISIDKISTLIEPRYQFINRINSIYYRETNKFLKNESVTMSTECFPATGLGCCGNYSGCCVVWDFICLEHDLACLKCDHWYCGWQCKPTPTNNN